MPRTLDELLPAPLDGLRAVCPLCRRLVAADAPCALDGAPPVRVDEAAGRERLVEQMWGAAPARAALQAQAATRFSQARAGGLIGGIVAGGTTIFAGLPTAVGLGVGLFSGLVAAMLASPAHRVLVPAAATPLPAWPVVARGRVEAAVAVVAPGTGARCAAWALELRHDSGLGRRPTLRAGVSAGFDVVLDGGERVRIPPGALWLDGPHAQVDDEDSAVADLVRALDPAEATAPWAVFPFNVITEATLERGARVELLGALERRPVADARDGSYRAAAASVLVPSGLPVLRRA